MIRPRRPASIAAGCAISFAAAAAHALPPRYDHVVIVVEENHSLSSILGSANAPYLNSLATAGTSFTNMHGLIHPSQPNYLELFSGSTQGSIDDGIPLNPQAKPTTTNPYATPNLGVALHSAGLSFGGYSQGLPAVGSQVASVDAYRRKHNPWANWQDNAWASYGSLPAVQLPNALPKSVNMPFTSFPSDFTTLPTVSVVVPDLLNDMHDGTIAQADTWLKANIDPYYKWAKDNNSLLIVTWDEDDSSAGASNLIPTIFGGTHVKAGGTVPQAYTLHNILRTVEDVYGLSHSGKSTYVRPIAGAFTTDPAVNRLTFRQGAGGYTGTKDTQIREAAATTAFAAQTTLSVDGDDNDAAAGAQRAQSLIRFDNIIAGAGGTIPTDATILSAKLTVFTTNPTQNPVELHRMVASWADTATWSGVGGGISANGVKAAAESDFVGAPPLLNNAFYFDVSDTLQLWVDGKAANNGWAILPTGSDGFGFVSAEGATAAQRPTLDVSYALYPRFTAAGGSWATAGNWANGTPNATAAVARFLNKGAATTVLLDGNRTVGTLLLDSPSDYTLNPGAGGTLTFANAGNVAALQAKQGQHTLAVPLSFTDPVDVDIAPGAKVTATAGVTVAAGRSLTKTSAGIVQIGGGLALGAGSTADVAAGELRVDRVTGTGSLHVRAGAAARLTATNNQASVVTALSISGATGAWAGTVDLGKAGLVVNYTGASPLATVADQIKSARAANWTGPGIGSAAAGADAATAVGVAEASTLLGLTGAQTAQFMGQTVDATSLLVRYTKNGDATLDGVVDFADLVRVAQNYDAATGAGTWAKGDFNYDGSVSFADLVIVAQNYGAALPAAGELPADFAAAFAQAAIPEPIALPLLALGLSGLFRRRGRAIR